MSGWKWKPGDVALVKFAHRNKACTEIALRAPEGGWSFSEKLAGLYDEDVLDVRPLLALDPDDREQMERLTVAYITKNRSAAPQVNMAAAVRSLLEPKKPEEPKGLGAVVVDADEFVYVRTVLSGTTNKSWRVAAQTNDAPLKSYAEINVVEVRSEGVMP